MLPYFQTSLPELSKLQTTWASQINPVLTTPLLQGIILPNVTLVIGNNVVNHLLGRKLQGWFIVRQRSTAAVHDTQDSNQTPTLTLQLASNAVVVVDLYVF